MQRLFLSLAAVFLGCQAIAADLRAEDAAAYLNRGLQSYKKGEYDKAIADFGEAIRLNPKYAEAYGNRGNAREDKGEYDKAVADYSQAVAINPKYAAAHNDLAWLQATCPAEKCRDGKKAFENASKAYQLDGGKHWGYIDTLAAAYAETGDFEKAKEWETKAIALATAEKAKTEMRSRLELYKQEKPYRQEPKKKS